MLIKKECGITFTFYTPMDNLTDYVLLYSRGTHTHAPPIASKTPPKLIHAINQLLLKIRARHLTLYKCIFLVLDYFRPNISINSAISKVKGA